MVVFSVAEADAGSRLDVVLARRPEVRSRSYAQQLISAGRVTLAGGASKKNSTVLEGQRIEVELPPTESMVVEADSAPTPIPIVHEDDDIIVVCKPAGMVVHPAAGHRTGTLVNVLLAHTRLADAGSPLRPGIVHRLDKDTSGLMVVAKNDTAYMELVRMIKRREVSRTYIALAKGRISEPRGMIDASLGRLSWDRKRMGVEATRAKPAQTKFKVLKRAENYTLVEASLVTGRTHQIRAHFAFIGHPLVGDSVYGVKGTELGLGRQFLHAYKLAFRHPVSGEELTFSCPLPEDLRESEKKIQWHD